MGHPSNGFTGRADFLQFVQVFFKEGIDGSHDGFLSKCREKYKWRVRFFKVSGRIRNTIARNGVKIPTSRKNREKWGTRGAAWGFGFRTSASLSGYVAKSKSLPK